MTLPIQPDDEITTHDGRWGIVVGIDGERISALDDGVAFDVRRQDIATINQQDNRPRAGAFPPPTSR
jgi:preprotein translocase subunit YajC